MQILVARPTCIVAKINKNYQRTISFLKISKETIIYCTVTNEKMTQLQFARKELKRTPRFGNFIGTVYEQFFYFLFTPKIFLVKRSGFYVLN